MSKANGSGVRELAAEGSLHSSGVPTGGVLLAGAPALEEGQAGISPRGKSSQSGDITSDLPAHPQEVGRGCIADKSATTTHCGLSRMASNSIKPPHPISWPHAPTHRLSETGVYMVTSGTYQKQRLFHDGSRLRMLHNALLTIADKHAWRLEAWAVFPNHYHFIAHAPEDVGTLTDFLRELHSRTAVALNRQDGASGRKVWHNYWDTQLTYEASYLARLHYVHHNPVKHGVVSVANQYPWCSAAWFERTATPVQVKTIYSFKIDSIHVQDDF